MSFFFTDTAPTEIYTLSLHDALPISLEHVVEISIAAEVELAGPVEPHAAVHEELREHAVDDRRPHLGRSEEHTSELQSLTNLVCRLLLEKKKKKRNMT